MSRASSAKRRTSAKGAASKRERKSPSLMLPISLSLRLLLVLLLKHLAFAVCAGDKFQQKVQFMSRCYALPSSSSCLFLHLSPTLASSPVRARSALSLCCILFFTHFSLFFYFLVIYLQGEHTHLQPQHVSRYICVYIVSRVFARMSCWVSLSKVGSVVSFFFF